MTIGAATPQDPQKQQAPAKQQGTQGEPKPVRKASATQHASKSHGAASKTNGKKKDVELTVGIPGAEMKQVQRQVPDDEAPPLAPNAQLSTIGKRTTRLDGNLKVTGAAKYTADIQLPGMLYGKLVDASVPHARIASIDTSAAEKHPGVRAIHVIEHVLGNAELKDKSKEPASRYPVVRYAGQPVAGIAAISPQAANEAAGLVKVWYEPMPFVVDLEQARKSDSPLVYPGTAAQGGTAGGGGGAENVSQVGNVRGPARKKRGDVDQALAQADARSEGVYTTQVQTHSALETHGVVADWKPDALTVHASTQGTSSVRDELAAIFGLPKSKVRVITEFMGGGFGAKFGAGNVGVVATHLSKKAGAPVKLMLDRKQEHLSVGNRPDSWQQITLGAKSDGTLTAIKLQQFGTAGVGTGTGTGGPASNMYKCENLLTEENDVFINAGPGAAFRAPGHPQGCFALEQAMDDLAEKLNIDPLVLRDKNDENPARREERRIGAQRFDWATKRRKPGSDTGPIKRGVGVAQSVWYRINNLDSGCEVRVTRDGSVELLSAVQDIGGGIRTALAQVVAEEFGLRPQDITIRIGDTTSPPGPPSGGSMTTGSITPPARNAAYKARQQMAEQIAAKSGATAEKVAFKGGQVTVNGQSMSFRKAASMLRTEQVSARADRSEDYAKGGPRITYGGVQFVEIAVDTETGKIHVEHVLAVHDCGRPINPLALESQINGGVLQGISYALYENRILDRHTGIMVNPNLEQYKIVGSRETPNIEIVVIENYLGQSSTDAGGIGEPSTIPTSAAIANAFYNATGARIRKLPMTPTNVLQALGKLPGEGARA